MHATYPNTWYAADVGSADGYPAFAGSTDVDVCVIGGGLAGLTTALEMVRAGRSVVLLEAERIGFGASGRNGGFVAPGYALANGKIAKRVGLANAKQLYELSREGAEYVRATIAALAPAIKMGDGWLVAMRHPGREELKAEQTLMAAEFGARTEIWDLARTRAALKSERYHIGMFVPEAFHIQPLAYALALAREVTRLGGLVHEASRATGWRRRNATTQIDTAGGSVRASQIVFATGGYERGLFAPLARSVLPVATYIAVTEPLAARADTAIATASAISDTRRAGDYYRRLPDGRILWGGRITTRRSEPERLAETMHGDMLSVYPQLEGSRMDFAWSGLMGYARHKMPVIGKAGDGLWMASAFGGHGLNTTAMAGQLIARAIVSGNEDWRQFEAFGAPWIGGPLGQVAAQFNYWGMQIQDRLDERRSFAH